MSEETKSKLIEQAKDKTKYVEIRIIIKLLGVVIIDYTWPPKKSGKES